VLASRREEPNPKTQIPGNSQTPNWEITSAAAIFEVFGFADLGFPWDLGFGAWDLSEHATALSRRL
jgi:hypothetical protein